MTRTICAGVCATVVAADFTPRLHTSARHCAGARRHAAGTPTEECAHSHAAVSVNLVAGTLAQALAVGS